MQVREWVSHDRYVYTAPDYDYTRHYDREAIDRGLVERCGYDTSAGWHPAKCGKEEPCPEHGGLRCDCGRLAKFACCHAGSQFVCGRPVCETHKPCCRHHSSGWVNGNEEAK